MFIMVHLCSVLTSPSSQLEPQLQPLCWLPTSKNLHQLWSWLALAASVSFSQPSNALELVMSFLLIIIAAGTPTGTASAVVLGDLGRVQTPDGEVANHSSK